MQVLKGLRYRAYPTEAQWPFLRHIGGCTRLVRNLALEQRKSFGRRGRHFGYEGQANELRALKAEAPLILHDLRGSPALFVDHAAIRTRRRSRSKLARP